MGTSLLTKEERDSLDQALNALQASAGPTGVGPFAFQLPAMAPPAPVGAASGWTASQLPAIAPPAPAADVVGNPVLGSHRRQEMATFARELHEEWKKLEQLSESEIADKADRENAKRRMEALAKGLPALANGIRDAVKGFQSGDPFAGSAAIMDVCGSLASTVGALSAAGGPPGALVGALFSIVSMVLKMFVKEQESLTKQLEKIVRTVMAEARLEGLGAAQDAIGAYIRTVTSPNVKWTWDDHRAMLNTVEGSTITSIRLAAHWLEQPLNHDNDRWREVLAAQCEAYIRLMQAHTIATATLDRADPMANEAYHKLTAAFVSNHPIQLAFLQRIMPVARDRGVLWHIGVPTAGYWGDSGPLRVRDSLTKKDTHHDGVARVFAIARTRASAEDLVDPFPHLAAFHLERLERDDGDHHLHGTGAAYRYRKSAKTYIWCGQWPMTSTSGWHELADLHGLRDICTIPGEEAGEVYVYTANGTEVAGYVHGDGHSRGDMRVRRMDARFPVPSRTTVDSVCAVSRPRTIADEDPVVLNDRNAALDDARIVYAGWDFNGKRTIRGFFSNGVFGDFECPNQSNLTGMTVDSKRLWVFNRHFIACATHASLKHCAANTDYRGGPRPDWAYYNIPQGPPFSTGPDPRLGIQDLAACDDGTLVAMFKPDHGGASRHMYTATPAFNRAEKSVRISGTRAGAHGRPEPTNGWRKIDGMANRVYKQPIFCWSLLEGLIQTLEKPVETGLGVMAV